MFCRFPLMFPLITFLRNYSFFPFVLSSYLLFNQLPTRGQYAITGSNKLPLQQVITFEVFKITVTHDSSWKK